MDSPCVSLEKICCSFHICIHHFDLEHHDHRHQEQSLPIQDHGYLCKADGAAMVGVKGNSQLVIVPQGVRCALGLKPR